MFCGGLFPQLCRSTITKSGAGFWLPMKYSCVVGTR